MHPIYPKVLHPIHKFRSEGKGYVADLACRKVIEITPVMWDILEFCTSFPLNQLVENLSSKYKESSIFEGIEQLERLGKAGLLFELAIPGSTKAAERLSIFSPLVSVDLVELQELPFSTNVNHYQLLSALGKLADVHINIRREQAKLEKEEGIFPIVLEDEASEIYSPVRFVPERCDGTLLLSGHPTADLPFLLHQQAPVICRVDGDRMQQNRVLELALNTASALRAWDALCVESSWLKQWLTRFTFHSNQIHVIPNGVDPAFLSPRDKASAKQMTAQIFESPRVLQQPVVGLLPSFEPQTAARFMWELARSNPHLMFLVLDPVLEQAFPLAAANVRFFGVGSLPERELLPTILNSLDLFCVPILPGTSLSTVFEVMACSVPTLILGEQMPEEMKGAGVLVPSEPGLFENPLALSEALSGPMNALLKADAQRTELATAARQATVPYIWEQTARRMIQLFRHLNRKREAFEPPDLMRFPIVFSRYYDKAQESATTLAFQATNGSYQNVEEALAEVLLREHSLTEVECVLRHFCSGPERAVPEPPRQMDSEKLAQVLKRLDRFHGGESC